MHHVALDRQVTRCQGEVPGSGEPFLGCASPGTGAAARDCHAGPGGSADCAAARSPFHLGPKRRELRIIALRPREVSDAFEGALSLLHNFDLQELLRVQPPGQAHR